MSIIIIVVVDIILLMMILSWIDSHWRHSRNSVMEALVVDHLSQARRGNCRLQQAVEFSERAFAEILEFVEREMVDARADLALEAAVGNKLGRRSSA